MDCKSLTRDGSCSTACKKFSVPCSLAVRRWTRPLTSDPVMTVLIIAILLLVVLS